RRSGGDVRGARANRRAAPRRGGAGAPLPALPPAAAGAHGRRHDAVAAAYPARPDAGVPDRGQAAMSAPMSASGSRKQRAPAAFRLDDPAVEPLADEIMAELEPVE